jgi:hypothetical protein
MEDLVAVEVTTNEHVSCYFITWGRIQHAVDPEPLQDLILTVAAHFAIPGTPSSVRLCDSLQEATNAPLFYEALFYFAQRSIPYGKGYERWRRKIDKRMRSGKELYFAGPFRRLDSAP